MARKKLLVPGSKLPTTDAPPNADAPGSSQASSPKPQASSSPGYRLEWVTAGSLKANPANWRTHPPEQAAAFKAALAKVKWTAPLLFNETTGRLVDGHLRAKSVPPETVVPVIMLQLTEEQERVALLTHDPLSRMAGTDNAMLEELLSKTDLDGDLAGVQDVLDKLLTEGVDLPDEDGKPSGAGDAAGSDAPGASSEKKLAPSYQVIADCANERQQKRVYDILKRNRVKCRVSTLL